MVSEKSEVESDWQSPNRVSGCRSDRAQSLQESERWATISDESDVQVHVVLKNFLIIIPVTLWQKAVTLAHECHQGLAKTKQLLWEKVWFPGIDQWVKRMIKKCLPCKLPCQVNSLEKHLDPLQMTPLPPAPWHTLHIDFCDPFPHQRIYVSCHWCILQVPRSWSWAINISVYHNELISVTHGIPTVLCSENRPPFTSHESCHWCILQVPSRMLKLCSNQHQRPLPQYQSLNVFLRHMAFLLSCAVTTDHHSQATSSRDTWGKITASSTEESPPGHKPTPRQKVSWSHSQKLYDPFTQKGRNELNICTDFYLTTELCHIPLLVRHQPHSYSTGRYETNSLK